MKPKWPGKLDHYFSGKAGEAFVSHCLFCRGWDNAMMPPQSAKYDILAFKDGREVRIQVKTLQKRQPNLSGKWLVRASKLDEGVVYTFVLMRDHHTTVYLATGKEVAKVLRPGKMSAIHYRDIVQLHPNWENAWHKLEGRKRRSRSTKAP